MIKFSILNINALREEMKKLNERIQEEVDETILAMSRVEIETVAKRNVPVDSGRLRASIITVTRNTTTFNYTDREGGSYDGMLRTVRARQGEVIVGTNVEYAEKIHERGGGGPNSGRSSGGQKKPKGYGKHFLKKAYDRAVPRIIVAVKRIKGVQ
jgi:hypothetical protein